MLATYAAELMKQKMDAMYEASGNQALSDQITYINKVIGSKDVAAEEKLHESNAYKKPRISWVGERLFGQKAKGDALNEDSKSSGGGDPRWRSNLRDGARLW